MNNFRRRGEEWRGGTGASKETGNGNEYHPVVKWLCRAFTGLRLQFRLIPTYDKSVPRQFL